MSLQKRCYFELNDNCRSINGTSDLSEKITKLEREGNKLRQQVESILHDDIDTGRSYTCDSVDNESCETAVDINLNWNDRYERNNASSYRGYAPMRCTSAYSDKFDDIALQRQLEETKERLEYVENKWKQETAQLQEERGELLRKLEEYKDKNYKFSRDYEVLQKEAQSKELAREALIGKLRNHLSQMVEINAQQEEVLLTSRKELEGVSMNKECQRVVSRMKQLIAGWMKDCRADGDNYEDGLTTNNLVEITEGILRQLYNESNDARRQLRDVEEDMQNSKKALHRDHERALMELRNQLSHYQDHNNYLKQEINAVNISADRDIEKAREETANIKSKMEQELQQATNVVDNLESTINDLSNKNKKNSENWSAEKKKFEAIVDETEKELAKLRGERDQALSQKSSIEAKLDATQNKLSETETQLFQLESDKYSQDRAISEIKQRNSQLESNLSSTRVYLESIAQSMKPHPSNDSELLDNQYKHQLVDEEDSWSESLVPATASTDKHHQDGDNSELWKPRKWEIDQMINQIKGFNKRIAEATDNFQETKQQLDSLQKQYDAVLLQKKKLEQLVKNKDLDIDSLRNDSIHVNGLLSNRNSEIERLTAERDYYFQMLNDKTEELANIKAENHRLTYTFSSSMDAININCHQLEERCRQLESNKSVNASPAETKSKAAVVGSGLNRSKSERIKEDKSSSQQQQHHQQLTAELKARCDQLYRENTCHSQQIEQVKLDNANLQRELRNIYADYDQITSDNKRLQIKLNDAEIEINDLCRELQQANLVKPKKSINLEKKISDLTVELNANRTELKLARHHIKELEKKSGTSNIYLNDVATIESTTAAAGAGAGTTESSSDSKQLHSTATKKRLQTLESQMSVVQANYKSVITENNKLTNLLKKVTEQNERLTEELESYADENNVLRNRINVLTQSSPVNKAEDTPTPSKHRFNDKPSSPERKASIQNLRDDLHNSIREARRLLSRKYSNTSNNNNTNTDVPNGTVLQTEEHNDHRNTTNQEAATTDDAEYDTSSSTLSRDANDLQKNYGRDKPIPAPYRVKVPKMQLNNNNNSSSTENSARKKNRSNTNKSQKSIQKSSANSKVTSVRSDYGSMPVTGDRDNDQHQEPTCYHSDSEQQRQYNCNGRVSSNTNVENTTAEDEVVKLISTGALPPPSDTHVMDLDSSYHKRSNRDSYLLEEKIKRILSET